MCPLLINIAEHYTKLFYLFIYFWNANRTMVVFLFYTWPTCDICYVLPLMWIKSCTGHNVNVATLACINFR